MEKRTGKGRGEHDQLLCWVGERTEALKASRKNGNRQPQEVGGEGTDTLECSRDMGGERLSGLKRRDLG